MADGMNLEGMQPTMPMSTTPGGVSERSVADITMGVVAALLFIPLSIVLVRLYIRCSVARRFRSDDCFITIAMTLAIANAVALVIHCKESMTTDVVMMKATWVFYMTSWPTLWAIKMNVLCQCSHIFAKLGSMHARLLIWGVMGLVTASMVAAIGSTLFACFPVEKLWIPGASASGCIDVAAMRFANTAISAFEDFVVLILACLVVLRTELNLRNKVYLVGILKLGAIAFVASIARVVFEGLALTKGANHHPRLWALLPIAAAFQVDLGIAAASLPSFAPLLPANRLARKRQADTEAILSRPTSRFGLRTLADEKLEMVNKSIIVEREYSIKTEFSPAASRSQSRRNSLSKEIEVRETGGEDHKQVASIAAIPAAGLGMKQGNGSAAALTTASATVNQGGDRTAQSVEDEADAEFHNRLRAARLLGLTEEENKYLSTVLPQRWSIWGPREKRESQQ